MSYQGNEALRSAGEKVEYTPETIKEIIKAREDIIYFAERYFSIVTVDSGEELIKLHDFQKKILKALVDPPEDKNHAVIRSGRQIGKCVYGDSKLEIRSLKTGKTYKISIRKFYILQKISKIKSKIINFFMKK